MALAPSLYHLQVGCRRGIPRLGSMPPGVLSERGACGRGREISIVLSPQVKPSYNSGFGVENIFLNRDPDLGNAFMRTPAVWKESTFPEEPLVLQQGS